MSLREQLFAKQTEPTLQATTFVGLPVFIRGWSERERIEWSTYIQSVKKDGEEVPSDNFLMCRCLAWSLADETGKLIFGRDEAEKLADFPSKEIQRVFAETVEFQQVPDADDAKKN